MDMLLSIHISVDIGRVVICSSAKPWSKAKLGGIKARGGFKFWIPRNEF